MGYTPMQITSAVFCEIFQFSIFCLASDAIVGLIDFDDMQYKYERYYRPERRPLAYLLYHMPTVSLACS